MVDIDSVDVKKINNYLDGIWDIIEVMFFRGEIDFDDYEFAQRNTEHAKELILSVA